MSAQAETPNLTLKPSARETLRVVTQCEGAPELTYKWAVDTVEIAGATGAEYVVTAGNVGSYTYNCTVSDGTNTFNVPFNVTVDNKLTAAAKDNITTIEVEKGQDATLSVVASCEVGQPTYKWSKDGNPIASDATYTETIQASAVFTCEVGDDYGSPAQTVTFNVTATDPTPIPALVSASAETASFTVKPLTDVTMQVVTECVGEPELTYKWSYNGNELTGPDQASLSMFMEKAGTHEYSCAVSDGTNAFTASFTIVVDNKLTATPLNNTTKLAVLTGNSAMLTVTAGCETGVVSYSWYRGDETEPVWTGAQYDTGTLNEVGEYSYTCVVSDDYESDAIVIGFTVTVSDNSALTGATADQESVTVAPLQTATLKVNPVCAGSPDVTYKWTCGEDVLQEGAQDSYTTQALTAVGETAYSCEVSDGTNTFTVPFTVTVDNALTAAAKDGITAIDVVKGETATLTVEATCTEGTPTYRWSKDGVAIDAVSEATFTTDAIQADAVYTCEVGDAYGSEAQTVTFNITATEPAPEVTVAITFGDTAAVEGVNELPNSAVVTTWTCSVDAQSFHYQVLDAEGASVVDETETTAASCTISPDAFEAGKVYTLKAGAKPVNGTDIVWAEAQFMIAVPVDNGDFEITDGVVTAYKGEGTAVEIPSVDTAGNAVTAIGASAFKGITTIVSVSIPGSVTEVGESAFEDCTGLESVTIPNGVTTIGKAAFKNCSKLGSMTTFD